MKIKYYNRNGNFMYTLNGEPLTADERSKYSIECRRARELFTHRREIVQGLPAIIVKLCKRFRIRLITQYL